MSPHDHLPTRALLEAHRDALAHALAGCPTSCARTNAENWQRPVTARLAGNVALTGGRPGARTDAGVWGDNGYRPAIEDAVRRCEQAKADTRLPRAA